MSADRTAAGVRRAVLRELQVFIIYTYVHNTYIYIYMYIHTCYTYIIHIHTMYIYIYIYIYICIHTQYSVCSFGGAPSFLGLGSGVSRTWVSRAILQAKSPQTKILRVEFPGGSPLRWGISQEK